MLVKQGVTCARVMEKDHVIAFTIRSGLSEIKMVLYCLKTEELESGYHYGLVSQIMFVFSSFNRL